MSTATLPLSLDELRALVVDELGLLTGGELDLCVKGAERRKLPLLRAIAERAGVPYAELLRHIAHSWQVEYVALRPADVDLRALPLVPEEVARRLGAMVLSRAGGTTRIACRDPRDPRTLTELRRQVQGSVTPLLADEANLRRAWLLYRPQLRDLLLRVGAGQLPLVMPEPGAPAPSAPDTLRLLTDYAAATGASDIHIEPFEHETLVRFRIDGVLQETIELAPSVAGPLVARVKVLSQMRVDEKRAPQDGRLHLDLDGISLDLRVSSLPTMWGEKLVLRVLTQDVVFIDLTDLGLSEVDLDTVVKHVLQPFGMVLVTGPTGSGKSTSLYAFLMRVAAERQQVVNISTVEDPIEYNMPRINQVPIRPDAGLDFAAGLRALLRQDPDVVMVGEIRDRETADMAVRAALVGRLLLSSLHTNDAASAVPRLLDMGVEPYLLASTLSLIVAQRLVRRVCEHCRESHAPDAALLEALERRSDWSQVHQGLQARGILSGGATLGRLDVFRGRGCARCHGTGFRGRVALFEVLAFDEALRRLVAGRADAATIRQAALGSGWHPMIVDGLSKALLGLTSPEEVLRAAG